MGESTVFGITKRVRSYLLKIKRHQKQAWKKKEVESFVSDMPNLTFTSDI